ncbi:four-carbon acid sugar kinase family protein [Lentibacillus sp. N15]|uniref:four-carbon acid sugar kinase family protein n=1 Tax=Lentibacillus songyuanensis TaxID=3136161 RepID=UPI0031BBBC27
MIGVVADDTTGANDIGVMFSKNKYSVKILPHDISLETKNDSDVLILDTNSRLDPPNDSYDKVYSSTKKLKEQGCSLYFNKTCSVFRGNIGMEFDAMLDALDENFAVVVLSFPKNGRKTIHGIHTVYGKLLEESEFANDPVHPMYDSNLVNILQKQTERKVSMVDIEKVRRGSKKLRETIEEQKDQTNYCIIDAEINGI